MPVNVWIETLDIKPIIVLDHDIDISSETGIEEFEDIKSRVTTVLKTSLYYVSDEEYAAMDRTDPDFKPNVQLHTVMKWLEESGSPEQYSENLNYLYNWADDHRVWLGA